MKDNRNFSEELIAAAKSGSVAGVSELLFAGANPKHHGSQALKVAADYGHVECVKLLIPVSNPKDDDSYALDLAARKGHSECVKLLIPVSDPKANDSLALRWAADNGHAECVKLLILVSDPMACGSLALRFAAKYGHVECVMLLAEPSGFGLVVDEIIDGMMGIGLDSEDFVKLGELQQVRHKVRLEVLTLQSLIPSAPSKPQNSRL